MNQSIAQEIGLLKEFLNQQNDLGIIVGNHQNLDTYAASLAMYLTLTQAGKKVQIISKKAPTVEVSNLVAINRVKENFVAGDTSKLVVSLPYIKGEVEKVLFTEFPDPQNPTNINFHLTAAEGKSITPFEQKDVKLIWEGGAPSAIIAIGAGSLDEISSIVDQNTTKIVNIDNFSGNTRYGDIVLVDDAFSSLSEVIGKIIKDLSLPLDVDSAQNILDGVLFSTRNFTKGNTSPLAFEAVSNAMYVGAQRKNDTEREISQLEPQYQPRPNQPRQNQPRQNQQPQQDRGREARPQNTDNRGQRINDNDFPAMHMQNRQQNSQGQQNPRNQQPRQQQNAPRQNQQFGQNRQQNAPRQSQQSGQNSQDIEELMRKINEENKNRSSGNNQQFSPQSQVRPQQGQQNTIPDLRDQEDQYQPQIQDAEIVNTPIINTSIEDNDAPDQMPYTPPSPDEVPDDWLMPKVFKSSKNNN